MDSISQLSTTQRTQQLNGLNNSSVGSPSWHVLWTRSHCEQLVHDQLVTKGFAPFLPKIHIWSRRKSVRRSAYIPMFPGYLFLQHTMDMASYIEVRKVRGLVALLGDGWDRLAIVPRTEIEAIQKVHSSGLPAHPHVFLRAGERVRIMQGLLAGAEGILLRSKANKGLLVISIHLLQRSVAVEVDVMTVAAA